MGTPSESAYDYSGSQGEVQGTESTDSNPSGPNPAWNDVLNVIPDQFHGMVTPHFQKWDAAANQRIESINTQFAPYQPFVEHGISQEDLIQGLRLMQQLNESPQEVYEALVNAYGYGNQQQNQQPQNPQQPNQLNNLLNPQQQELVDPRVDRLQQGVDLMARIMYEQEQQMVSAQADSDLDTELNALKQKHGDFDEKYVLAYMNAGMTGDQAAQSYNQMKNSMLTNNPRPFAPSVMGNNSGQGAGIPSDAVDVTKLNGKETRNLVVEMLARAASQRT